MKSVMRILILFCLFIAPGWSQEVLLAGGGNGGDGEGRILASSEIYDPTTQAFTASGSMHVGRIGHTATLFRNGYVLIAGGDDNAVLNYVTNSAEVYSAATGSFTVTGKMISPRVGHTAVLLPDGDVLIAGGQNIYLGAGEEWSSAELYNPRTGKFTATGNMTTPRVAHTATLLNNGLVLIAGGGNSTGVLASAELYNPSTHEFTATGSMSIPRDYATATLLKSGEVLIAGGDTPIGGCNGCPTDSAEIYNPVNGTFTLAGPLGSPRYLHTATLLPSGNVLITGGWDPALDNALDTTEIFDATLRTFSAGPKMYVPRSDHSATALCDGNILIAGGTFSVTIDGTIYPIVTPTAEIYDVKRGVFENVGLMTSIRFEQTATSLETVISSH